MDEHTHRCQGMDDLQAEVAMWRNLVALGPYATPESLPPYPPRRQAALLKLMRKHWRLPVHTTPAGRPVDLWAIPRQRCMSPDEAATALRQSNRGGRA